MGTVEVAAKRPKRKAPPGGRGPARKRKWYSFELKLRVVKFYLEEGFSQAMIVQETGVYPGAVYKWVKQYRTYVFVQKISG